MVTAQPSGARLAPELDDTLPIPTPALAPGAHASHRFTLYASQGRVLASNVRDKLIDLGTLQASDGAGWSYDLDGEDCPAGSGFASAQEALAGLAQAITFLYLDGQFTAQRDLSDQPRPDLPDAPQVAVTLDPRGQAEPVLDTPT